MVRITLLMTAMSLPVLASESDNAQTLLQEWLKLEQQVGSIQTNWSQRKVSLQQQLSLLNKEKETLTKLINYSKSNNDKVSEERLQLIAQQAKLEQYQNQSNHHIQTIIAHLSRTEQRLPKPLQKEWGKTLADLNNSDNSSTKLESITQLLKKSDDFNNRVVLHQGLIKINHEGQEKQVFVNQVYLGMGHGWYISEDKKYYGYGKSDQHGWTWWHGDSAKEILGHAISAAQIERVTKILRAPTQAQYVQLPLSISNNKGSL